MINFYNEKLTPALFAEMLPIIKESKEEVYGNNDNKTLYNSIDAESLETHNIDTNYLFEKQRSGMFQLSTVRNEKGVLVGYWALTMFYHSQSKNLLVANCENLHIIKAYRGGDNAKKLMAHTEEALKRRGVKQIFFGVNPALRTDLLLRRAGWSLDELVFTKGL